MSEDIIFAIRLQANESGIYDEEIIQSLIDEYYNKNFSDMSELIEDTFDVIDPRQIYSRNGIIYSRTSPNYRTAIDSFYRFNNAYDGEIINDRAHQSLRRQYQVQNSPTPSNILHTMPSSILHTIPSNIPQAAPSFYSSFSQLWNQQTPVFGSTFTLSATPMNLGSLNSLINQLGGGLNLNLNNMFQEPVAVTLTESALNNIKDLSYQEVSTQSPNLDPNEQCAICFAKLTEDKEKHKYNILPCHHIFHTNCIKEYLKEYNYHCPICKEECGEHKAKINEGNEMEIID
jgi:hypothetical protein